MFCFGMGAAIGKGAGGDARPDHPVIPVNAIARLLLDPSRLTAHKKVGCLIAYSPNHLELFRHAAVFVDKILKGAKPADLLVELPHKLELVINLMTAEALGLTLPPTLLFRADKVIK